MKQLIAIAVTCCMALAGAAYAQDGMKKEEMKKDEMKKDEMKKDARAVPVENPRIMAMRSLTNVEARMTKE